TMPEEITARSARTRAGCGSRGMLRAPSGVMPVTYEKHGALGMSAPAGSCGRPVQAAVSVETLHPAEIKHAICVRSFHQMRSFHVVAARGAAALREPGIRAGSGPAARPR